MRKKVYKIIGLGILAACLLLVFMPQAGFAALPAPTNLRISSVVYNANNTADVKLSWDYPAGTDFAGFCVQYTTVRGNWYGCQFPIWDPNARITGNLLLSLNTTYYFRVIAVRGNWLEYTISAEFTYFLPSQSPAGNPPPAPSNLTATAVSANQINLAWQDNSSNETSFEIQRGIRQPYQWVWAIIGSVGSNINHYEDTNVTPNTEYGYLVRAKNQYGTSDWAGPAYADTPEAYSISGAARDQSNNNLSGVTVAFYNATGSKVAETITGASGYSQFLPPGDYTLKATKEERIREPNAGNPIMLTNANVPGIDFMFCSDINNMGKILYIQGQGELRDWDYSRCLADKCYQVYKFRWGGLERGENESHAGDKTLQEFGDSLNQYIKDNKIDEGGSFTIVAHSFGALIARAAIIRAKEEETNPNYPRVNYNGVHLIQVAGMIGGDYWAGKPPVGMPATWPTTRMYNMDATGRCQKWLYDPADGGAKFKEKIGNGRVDILMAEGDTVAPPARRQLFNPWLENGLREGLEYNASGTLIRAPIVADDKTHNNVLEADEVCALVRGGGNARPLVPIIVVKDAYTSFSGSSGDLIVTLYNLGAPATNVKANLSISTEEKRITITKADSNFGNIDTGKDRDNSLNPFKITLPAGTATSHMAPKVTLTITADVAGVRDAYTDTAETRPVIYPWWAAWRIFASNSTEPKSINFAKKALNFIFSLSIKDSIAQEAPDSQLSSQPVLADLDKDGNLETIIPVAGRKINVVRNNGTNFWQSPYNITDPGCAAIYPVAADINTDGNLEIILAEYGVDVLRILDKNGNLLRFVSGIKVGMPAVADIDNSGDGKMEIVVAKDGVVTMLDSEGRILWSKTNLAGYTPATSAPVLVDLNGDGNKEIITGDICVLDKNGNILWSKPSSGGSGPAVADLNNDGRAEIVSASGLIYRADGSLWLKLFDYISEYPPIIADLNADGKLEVLSFEDSGDLRIDYDISQNGSKTAGFSYDAAVFQRLPLSIYDMDNDGKLEIVVVANYQTTDVTAGTIYTLWFTGSGIQLIDAYDTEYKITHAPVLADINKDRISELILGDLASGSNNKLDCFPAGISGQGTVFWPQFQRDTLRTGLYDIQPPQLSAIGNKTVNAGQSLSFTVSATDQLVGKLSFSAYPLPQGARLINNGNGTASFSWTPAFNQAGVYRITFVVSDGALVSSEPISITVLADTTAPTTPVVTDQGTTTLSAIAISASWNSSDPESGIAEYQYRITEGSTSGAVIRDWTSTGTANSVTATGLSLKDGKTYYFAVKAKNGAGLWSGIGYSDGIAVSPVIGWDIPWGFLGAVPVSGDFDADGKADLAVYHPATGSWYIRSVSGTVHSWNFNAGFSGGIPVSGDYFGDNRSDFAAFRSGVWYYRAPGNPVYTYLSLAGKGDVPVSGDYDGDGKTDFAVYNSATGKWSIKKLYTSASLAWDLPWGFKGAIPVAGDYDGDTKADLAVYHSAAGNWYIKALDGRLLAWQLPWGFSSAIAVPGDYDGDRKADLAVYDTLTGKWYIKALDGRVLAWGLLHGFKGAVPVPGDYDGDGKSDLAVYYPATSKWYIRVLR